MKLLIVDIETTSAETATARILEIAVASVDLKTGETKLLISELVRPDCLDWRDCWFLKNSGIPEYKIRECVPLDSCGSGDS